MKLPRWILRQFKKKSRVYIMPTPMGGYLNGLIFLMFFLAVGYNNNLLLIFTLFLFGLNVIWVIQSHYHLHHLKFKTISIEDGHADEPILTRLFWEQIPEAPNRWEISLEDDEGRSFKIVNTSNHSLTTEGEVIFNKRGVWKFPHIKVINEMPFGLYRTWIYFKLDVNVYVYPKRIWNLPLTNYTETYQEGEFGTNRKGPHDFLNLAPYENGESSKISWKRYARSGELVIKEGEELKQSIVSFKIFPSLPDKEFSLSRIASQMINCLKNQTSFSLETPNKKIGPDNSQKHLVDCLRELAKC